MQKSVTLLVCLSPSVPHETITELDFYEIVAPVTPVHNVRLIEREGQMKAFVQVSSQKAANLAIDSLHCQLLNLGKTKLFISNKAAINYNMSIDQVLKLRGGKPRSLQAGSFPPTSIKRDSGCFNYDSMNEKNSQGRTKTGWDSVHKASVNPDALDASSSTKRKIIQNQHTKSTEVDSSCAVKNVTYKKGADAAQCSIKITHDSVHELDSKKVSKLFRRYGRIVNLDFDYEQTFWRITYISPKDVQKVVKAYEKNKLFGYELYDHKMNAPAQHNSEESCGIREIVHYLSGTEPQSSNDESVTLRIDVTAGYASIEEICRMVGKVCTPIELAQGYDTHDDSYFYLAKFVEYEQAAEVLFVLNSVYPENCSINARFE